MSEIKERWRFHLWVPILRVTHPQKRFTDAKTWNDQIWIIRWIRLDVKSTRYGNILIPVRPCREYGSICVTKRYQQTYKMKHWLGMILIITDLPYRHHLFKSPNAPMKGGGGRTWRKTHNGVGREISQSHKRTSQLDDVPYGNICRLHISQTKLQRLNSSLWVRMVSLLFVLW